MNRLKNWYFSFLSWAAPALARVGLVPSECLDAAAALAAGYLKKWEQSRNDCSSLTDAWGRAAARARDLGRENAEMRKAWIAEAEKLARLKRVYDADGKHYRGEIVELRDKLASLEALHSNCPDLTQARELVSCARREVESLGGTLETLKSHAQGMSGYLASYLADLGVAVEELSEVESTADYLRSSLGDCDDE